MTEEHKTITEDEVTAWSKGAINWHTTAWLKEILTGEYPLDAAREDILSLRKP